MVVSSMPGGNVILDPIVVWYDMIDALDPLLENELFGGMVSVQPAKLGHYRYEEV